MKEATVPDFQSDYVDQVRAAEAAAQRSVCNIPTGDVPAELKQALERRIEVNLEQADGKTITRVGSKDPTVRDLEAPWSRRVSREQKEAAAQAAPKPRRRKATAKKPAAKKAATTTEGTDS